MFSESTVDAAVLLQLQRAPLSVNGYSLVYSFFVLGTLAVAIDYARMLYLHFKMV